MYVWIYREIGPSRSARDAMTMLAALLGRTPDALILHTLTPSSWPRALFDVAGVYFRDLARVVHMDRSCGWKYLVYIESFGYSSSLKLRLACGSVLFQGDHAMPLAAHVHTSAMTSQQIPLVFVCTSITCAGSD